MAKKKGGGNAKKFRDYADKVLDNYLKDGMDIGDMDGEENEEEVESVPIVNEAYVQAFADEWQPEHNERLSYVRAFSMGELREYMHIYRTFDAKAPDPLPCYLTSLASHGFDVKMGCSGELVLLASRRSNGRHYLTTE